MKGHDDYNRALRRAALHRTGLDPDLTRTFAEQVSAMGMSGSLLRLPANMLPLTNLQDPDTGDFYYLADFSEIDGDDLIQ